MERIFYEQTHRAHLDLQSIGASLRGVQSEFPRINQALKFSREPMDDEVVENLMSGYALFNHLLAADIDLFALGSSSYLLGLNTRVLCGTSEQKRREYHKHIAASNRNFYYNIKITSCRLWKTHEEPPVLRWPFVCGFTISGLKQGCKA